MEILQVENLSFSYPNTKERALKNITFSVSEGDFIVICGESGCGKTTLLKMLKRELSPYGDKRGRVLYKGRELSELNEREAAGDIGFVMQNPEQQIVTDKVWHELAFGLENLGMETNEIRRRVGEMASYFGIAGWFHSDTDKLSGGQKQILNLASVMAMQPNVLLLDEPTSQLDPVAASEFVMTLQRLNRELGLTVLLVEHRLEDVFSLANKVLVMENGELIFFDEPRAVGERLMIEKDSHPIHCGLPSALRIYRELGVEAARCPLTVRDGRRFLTEHFLPEQKAVLTPDHHKTENTILEMKNVWFRYEKNLPDVLRGVSLRVSRGESYFLLGGNAAGKTTVLHCAAGLQRPYRGKISLLEKKKRTGKNAVLLPQDPATVFVWDTVREDLLEACSSAGLPEKEWEGQIEAVCEQTGTYGLLSKHPYDLSGGEQQKCALAKILLHRPEILLLDEPTKGLDAHAKQELSTLLQTLKKDGVTIVAVTHDVEFAAENSDRCALLFDGQIISCDTPRLFFSGNTFYTTSANRMAHQMYRYAVTCDEVVAACKRNGVRHA